MDRVQTELTLTGLIKQGLIKKWKRITDLVDIDRETYFIPLNNKYGIVIVTNIYASYKKQYRGVNSISVYLVDTVDKVFLKQQRLYNTKAVAGNLESTIKGFIKEMKKEGILKDKNMEITGIKNWDFI